MSKTLILHSHLTENILKYSKLKATFFNTIKAFLNCLQTSHIVGTLIALMILFCFKTGDNTKKCFTCCRSDVIPGIT